MKLKVIYILKITMAIFLLQLISENVNAQTVKFTWQAGWGLTGGLDTAGLDTITYPYVIQNRLACPAAGDIDGDGDVDFIVGDQDGGAVFFKNIGTSTKPHWGRQPLASLDTIKTGKGIAVNQMRPELADIDNDGDLDLLFGSRYAYDGSSLNKLDDLIFFRNIGTKFAPEFTHDTIPGLSNQQCAEFANPCFVDIDGDGDLDLIIIGSDSTAFFENTGTASSPNFVRYYKNDTKNPLKGWANPKSLISMPNLVDMDSDGDFDLVYGDDDGFVRMIENKGTKLAPSFDPDSINNVPLPGSSPIDFGQFVHAEVADYNSDGVLDIMVVPFTPVKFYWYKGVLPCNVSHDTLTVTSCPNYKSPSGKYTWTANGTYNDTITNNCGLDSLLVINLTIGDATPPVVQCKNIIRYLPSTGTITLTTADLDSSTTDACSPFTLALSKTSFTCADTGSNTVQLIATDSAGNVDSCAAVVTILDTISPTLSNCPSPISTSVNAIGCGAIVTWTAPTALDNCSGATLSSSHNSGSFFASGKTTVTYTATDVSGNTAMCSFDVTVNGTINAVVDSIHHVSCNGESNGQVFITTTGTSGYITYDWSNDGTGDTNDLSDVSGLVKGTYTAFIKDSIGCKDTVMATVTEPNLLVLSTQVDSNVSCFGFTNGGASASATGGTTAYSWNWSNGDKTAAANGMAANTYQVTVTDANNCTDTGSVTITQPTALTSSVVIDSNVFCNGGSDGGATVTASGGTTAYSYSWSNSAVTASITGVSAQKYYVTVTDNKGCTVVDSATITQPQAMGITAKVDSNVSCNGLSNGGASVSASGGSGTYSWLWSNSDTSSSITGLSPSSYYVTVTDGQGCTNSDTVTITQPALLVATAVVDSNVSCKSLTNGGASVSSTGGTGTIGWSWSTSATVNTISNVAAGKYYVTATDANGCTDSSSVTITEPDTLTITSKLDSNVSCFGGANGGASTTTTGGTIGSGYTWKWSDNSTDSTLKNVAAASYTVTVTDANGCTDTASVAITQPTALSSVETIDSTVSCFGLSNGGASVAVSGGTTSYSYKWSNNATTSFITGVTAQKYFVTITDKNGCTLKDSADITEPKLLVATAKVDSTISCKSLTDGGASVTSTGGTGTISWSWSNSGTMASITGVKAGKYYVTATDANKCTDSASVTITEPDTLVVTAVVDSNVTCKSFSNGGASAKAKGGTGTYSWKWSNAGLTSSISGVVANTYTVTVTDKNGCDDTMAVTITEPDSLLITVTHDSNVTCFGLLNGGASASAKGGTLTHKFSWSNSAVGTTLVGVGKGTYTVTVLDAQGCTDTGSVTITEPDSLILSATVDAHVSCKDLTDASASTTIMGGSMPYVYLWSSTDTTSGISGKGAGKYSLTATDSLGCTDTASITITEPDSLIMSIDSVDFVKCKGDSNGVTYTTIVGGTQKYSYAWSNGDTVKQASGLPQGPISVTVTDAQGCQYMASDSIGYLYELPVLDLGPDVTVSVSSVTLQAPDTFAMYLWSNGDTTSSSKVTTVDTFNLTVTDSNGCIARDTILVSLWPSLVKEHAETINLSVYPNPSNGEISIQAPSLEGELKWEAYSLTGKKVDAGVSEGQANSNRKIDLGNQPQGSYILRLTHVEGTATVRVIIR